MSAFDQNARLGSRELHHFAGQRLEVIKLILLDRQHNVPRNLVAHVTQLLPKADIRHSA
jgi:hypothetical protein